MTCSAYWKICEKRTTHSHAHTVDRSSSILVHMYYKKCSNALCRCINPLCFVKTHIYLYVVRAISIADNFSEKGNQHNGTEEKNDSFFKSVIVESFCDVCEITSLS